MQPSGSLSLARIASLALPAGSLHGILACTCKFTPPPTTTKLSHILTASCCIAHLLTFPEAALYPLRLVCLHFCPSLPFPHCNCTLCLCSTQPCHYLLIPGCASATNRHSTTTPHCLTTSQLPPYSGLPSTILQPLPTFAHCPLLPHTLLGTLLHTCTLRTPCKAPNLLCIFFLCA